MRLHWVTGVVAGLATVAVSAMVVVVPVTVLPRAAPAPPAGFLATVIANNEIFAPTLMSFTPEGNIVIAQQNGKVKILSAVRSARRRTSA